MSKRHKWDGKAVGSYAVGCMVCGCVKEIIAGKATYFIKDTVYDKAPKCKPQELEHEFIHYNPKYVNENKATSHKV